MPTRFYAHAGGRPTAPSQGRYRLFFEFQFAGTVHTAEYTLVV